MFSGKCEEIDKNRISRSCSLKLYVINGLFICRINKTQLPSDAMHLIAFTQVLYLSMIFNFYFHFMLICISLNYCAFINYFTASLLNLIAHTKTARSVHKI